MKKLKNVRLPSYDYSADGYYFITLVSRNRRSFTNSEMNIIASRMDALPRICEGSRIDSRIIMHNHVHGIVILENCKIPLGEIVRKLKALCSREAGICLWQPNYYEHVIRTEKALAAIREYIQNNPVEEKINVKSFY